MNGSRARYDHLELIHSNDSMQSVVALAHLQPGSPVLDLGYENAQVAVAAKEILSLDHESTLVVLKSGALADKARSEFTLVGLDEDTDLSRGDATHLDAIDGFGSPASEHQVTFDVIFAYKVLNTVRIE